MALAELRDSHNAHRFLRRLSLGVTSFGTQVGIPMLFHPGSTLYGIIDGETRRGDNDTAHSVAFGLWYFVIVIVAVASSLVLGVSSPKALEAIFDDYQHTSGAFKLRWLDERRMQLWDCSRLPMTVAHGRVSPILPEARYAVIFTRYLKRSCLVAGLILALPCVPAVVVSYSTPLMGFSCRSTTLLSYIAAQELLIILWYFHSSPQLRQAKQNAVQALDHGMQRTRNQLTFLGLSTVSFLYHFMGVLSVLITVGGSIMQLLGVYRNCICKAGLYWSLPTTRSWVGAYVKVTDDTQDDRNAASTWLVCGGIGMAAVAIMSLLGAWHSMRIRQRCVHVIDELYWSEDIIAADAGGGKCHGADSVNHCNSRW